MKRTILAATAALCLLIAAGAAYSWEAQGTVYGTDIDYSSLAVSREGVKVRFANTYDTDVKVSLKLHFYDKAGNAIGYSIFGLREIPGNTYIDVEKNYLNGNWRACRDAFRIRWEKMTYEPIY